MNIIVLHGDHVTKSRQRLDKFLSEAKKRNWEVQFIDPGKNLPEELSAVSLFQKERFYVLTNPLLFSQKELTWFKKKNKTLKGNLVIYHSEILPKSFFSLIPPDHKKEEFFLPKTIFIFLESIRPGNIKQTLRLFHNLLTGEPVEFVFALLVRHIKDLYWIKSGGEKMDIPPWRAAKLKKQASYFSLEKLSELISFLSQADIEAKTSQGSLTDSLDLFITQKLE